MSEERPITPAMAKELGEQIKTAMASGSDDVGLEIAGRRMHMVRTGDGGYAIGEPGEEGATRIYFEPAEQPESYPSDIPFVPGATVTVMETGGGVSLMYWSPPNSEALVQELVNQTIAAGWLLESQQDIPLIGVTNSTYRLGQRERLFMNAMGVVTVMEKYSRK